MPSDPFFTIPTLEQVQAKIDERSAEHLSVEEGCGPASCALVRGDLTAAAAVSPGVSFHLFTALRPVKLVQVGLTHWDSADIAANDTNYWGALVSQHLGAGASAAVVSKTTKIAGGQAWPKRSGWTFDLSLFDPTNSLIPAGSCVGVQLTATGTPATLTNIHATWLCEPQ